MLRRVNPTPTLLTSSIVLEQKSARRGPVEKRFDVSIFSVKVSHLLRPPCTGPFAFHRANSRNSRRRFPSLYQRDGLNQKILPFLDRPHIIPLR